MQYQNFLQSDIQTICKYKIKARTCERNLRKHAFLNSSASVARMPPRKTQILLVQELFLPLHSDSLFFCVAHRALGIFFGAKKAVPRCFRHHYLDWSLSYFLLESKTYSNLTRGIFRELKGINVTTVAVTDVVGNIGGGKCKYFVRYFL